MNVATSTTRWAVLYRVGKAGRAAHTDVWLVIADVPAELGAGEVEEALQAWHRWPSWQSRVGVNGRVAVQPERSWPAAVRNLIDPPAPAAELLSPAELAAAGYLVSWSELAPTTRRLTTPLDSHTYAAVRRAAAELGQPLVAWCGAAITEKLARQRAHSLPAALASLDALHTAMDEHLGVSR